MIPFDECTGKGSFADSVSKRIFYPRYNLAWLSLEFQKTQPSNYAEITKSRKVKRMAETMLLGPRSVLQAESRTSQTAVSRLVPGRLETHSYIDSAEYAAGTVIFDKYKSPAVQKAIQTAKTATKVSFYRFVQFIKNLSNDLIFEADVAAMRKNRDKMKEKAKKPKKEKRMTDHSSHADEPASNSGAREGSVHEKSKTKLSDNLERRYSIGENSLGSAAFDELVEECNNVAELLPEHRSSPAGSTSVSKEHVNTSRSHSFTGSEDETASIDTLSDFASEHFSAVGDVQRKDDDAVKSAAGNMLEFIMLRLRVLISKVDIEHLHFRSSRMSTRNIAAREAVFSDSTVLEATRHLGGGLSIKDITAGILALRGGALDDPEVRIGAHKCIKSNITNLFRFCFNRSVTVVLSGLSLFQSPCPSALQSFGSTGKRISYSCTRCMRSTRPVPTNLLICCTVKC